MATTVAIATSVAIGAFAATNAVGQVFTYIYENWVGPVHAYTHYYGAPGHPVYFNDGEGSVHSVCIGQANLQVGPYCSSSNAPHLLQHDAQRLALRREQLGRRHTGSLGGGAGE